MVLNEYSKTYGSNYIAIMRVNRMETQHPNYVVDLILFQL